MKKLQELLATTSEPEVIESEIYSAVIDAVKANLVGTNLLALRLGPKDIPGSSIDVDLQTRNNMTVSLVGEGDEVPISNEAFTTFNLKPLKYGLRPFITKEMIEDAKFALLERALQESGYQMARQLDTLIMAQIEAGSTNASFNVTGGAAITVSNITTAMANLESNGYKATDFVLHPNVVGDIRNIDTFVEADKAGVVNPTVGLIGTIFGMKVWQSEQVTSNYAYVLDKNNALVLAEKRPITVVKYSDDPRDIAGAVITARWGVRFLRNQANSVITTT